RANGTVAQALAGAGLDAHITEAIAARTEVSCAYGAEDLDASVLRAGASAFGRFDSFIFAGGNGRLAEGLAERLPHRVRLGAPFLAAFAGSPAALERLEIDRGPHTWLHRLVALRPDLAVDQQQLMLSTWDDDPWVQGAYSARSVRSPMQTEELARPLGALAFA